MTCAVKPPFPYFGGKSKVAPAVWQRFGNVPNDVEPFAGSLAVLLNRPHEPKTETVNDLDCYIANFWRALQCDPDEVARWADWPVNEADLHARHNWLLNRAEFRQQMHHDPDYYDAKIAGWWVWGICQWIGSGWCAEDYYDDNGSQKRPHLGNAGQGVHRPSQKLPHLGGRSNGGGQGINRNSNGDIHAYMQSLADRLRRVRVCCGDWSRVLGDSVTHKHGLTAVFLDPPYSHDLRDNTLYGREDDCAADVRAWAIENGNNPLLRIALCGYADEHAMPDSWECYRWKTSGGYGSQGNGAGRDNANRECIWFNPACISQCKAKQSLLFDLEVSL
jgi:hypothetical protein